MSPFGAIAMSVGPLRKSGPLPGIIKIWPVGLNLTTTAPRPLLVTWSEAYTLPSRSTPRPCGWLKMFAANEVTNLPFGSNFWIGLFGELAHELPPQRSNTQMLLPSLSASTPIVDPILRPAGSCAQFSSRRYGFGAALGS